MPRVLVRGEFAWDREILPDAARHALAGPDAVDHHLLRRQSLGVAVPDGKQTAVQIGNHALRADDLEHHAVAAARPADESQGRGITARIPAFVVGDELLDVLFDVGAPGIYVVAGRLYRWLHVEARARFHRRAAHSGRLESPPCQPLHGIQHR